MIDQRGETSGPSARDSSGMAVGELAGRTGLTPATINFYVRSGLLPRPLKTSRTRAVYAEESVARLGRIKEMQDAGLSLRVIRQILDGDQRLVALGVTGAASTAGRPRRLPPRITGVASFMNVTGLREEWLRKLVELGLIKTNRSDTAGEPVFERRDIAAGLAFARLLAEGVDISLIARHTEYEPVARAEAHLLAEHIAATKKRGRSAESSRVVAAFGMVRDYLRLQQLDASYPGWGGGASPPD